jgi:flagellar hook-associated protein 3 FlgL
MMTDSLARYLTAQNEALYERQTIIASQKRINRPSDDPIGMGKVLDYRQTLSSIEQYKTNIQSGQERLKITEITLELVDELLQGVRAIALTEAGGTTESRQLTAGEVPRSGQFKTQRELYVFRLSNPNSAFFTR